MEIGMKNVILMTIDACRKDLFGWYGNESGLTPFMDSLEGKSIKFTNAQAIGPYTQASFPGILSSSYYLDFGFQEKCPRERVLVSEVIKKAGVITVGMNSNPYLSDYFGWNRGWDLFVDFMDQKVTPKFPFIRGDRINRKAKVWLKSYKMSKSDKPFFLWIHYMDMHEPYIPKRENIELVDSSVGLRSEDEMFDLFKNVLLKRDVSDTDKVALLKNLYLAKIKEIDKHVEQFFNILDDLDFLKNSTIIITTDHGDEFNDHGSLSHDSTMYSELIDEPLLIYDADREKPITSDTLVSNLDIPPTITHLLNAEPSEKWQGHSLLPLGDYSGSGCYGEAIEKKGHGESKEKKEVHYYREGEFKIIYRQSGDIWEMYDLGKDPKELNNIVDASPVSAEMKKKIEPRIKRASK